VARAGAGGKTGGAGAGGECIEIEKVGTRTSIFR